MAVKLGIVTWAGGRPLLLRVAPALLLMTLGAVAAFVAVAR